MSLILQMLNNDRLALTRKKGLYALSAVVRGNHKAQANMMKLNGLGNVLRIVKDSTAGLLRVKAITLLFDLIVEQNEAMEKLIENGKKKKSDR